MLVIDNRQTLLDLAVEHLGDAERLVELALLNSFDIDDIDAGIEFVLPEVDINKARIINGLKKQNIHPASALDYEDYALLEDEWTLYYTVGLPANHG